MVAGAKVKASVKSLQLGSMPSKAPKDRCVVQLSNRDICSSNNEHGTLFKTV